MILHRLRLTNFRGVADREIEFPDQGVVVVCGPNEVGKSSMLEALDLLLTYRDRSTHRDVKAVKPANADVGSQVEAEISTGPYRFVYRKRFHKKAGTELEIIEPKREQLSGDNAHDRVEAMLAETLDTKLWNAQRVLQSASTDAVNLSGSDSLARALDAAAGETDAAPAGDESLLIDLVDAEYLKYFTATGRPTGPWKAVSERVSCAEAEESSRLLAIEEVNERVCRHERLTSALQMLDESLAPAAERFTAARKAHDAIADLCEQLRQARQMAATVAATSTNSALANSQRRQLVADAEHRNETLVGLPRPRRRRPSRPAPHSMPLSSASIPHALPRRLVSPVRRPTGWRPASRVSMRSRTNSRSCPGSLPRSRSPARCWPASNNTGRRCSASRPSCRLTPQPSSSLPRLISASPSTACHAPWPPDRAGRSPRRQRWS